MGWFHQLEINGSGNTRPFCTILEKGWRCPGGRGEGAGPGWVDTREERRGVARELQKMYNSPKPRSPYLDFYLSKI